MSHLISDSNANIALRHNQSKMGSQSTPVSTRASSKEIKDMGATVGHANPTSTANAFDIKVNVTLRSPATSISMLTTTSTSTYNNEH